MNEWISVEYRLPKVGDKILIFHCPRIYVELIDVGGYVECGGWYGDEFIKSNEFELIEFDTFWLSETPDEVSKGWDAALNRICTFGLFKNKKTMQLIWVFNTHFDHVGEIARRKSAQLIQQKIEQVNSRNYPVIIMGDFNLEPNSEAISFLKNVMNDTYEMAIEPPYGPSGTFNAFNFDTFIFFFKVFPGS